MKAAAREFEPRQSEAVGAGADGRQQCVTPLVQQRVVGDGAGSDDPHDLAFDRALGLGGIPDLLADRDRLALAHRTGKVVVEGLNRYARHRNRLAAGRAACRQGDVEQARGLARILEEQLVEVPHPVEQEHVRVLRLDAQVLGHDRGLGRFRARIGQSEPRSLAGMKTPGPCGPGVSSPCVPQGGATSSRPVRRASPGRRRTGTWRRFQRRHC